MAWPGAGRSEMPREDHGKRRRRALQTARIGLPPKIGGESAP